MHYRPGVTAAAATPSPSSPAAHPGDARLLACLSPRTNPAHSARLPQTPADWHDLLQRATRHGLTPLLYERLGIDRAPNTVPADTAAALREAYLVNSARNALIGADLAQVLKQFHAAGLPVILLKGAHLAAAIYDTPGARPMGDLDLLLPEADLARASQLLRQSGYVSTEPDRPGDAHLPPLFKPPGPRIELHWTLMPSRLPFQVDTPGLWTRSQPFSLAGLPARVLCPEDLLLHLCLHTGGDEHDPFLLGLRPLCDIDGVIRRQTVDWDALGARARSWRAARCATLALELAVELLGAPVPPAALARLRAPGWDLQWLELAREQALARGHPDPAPAPALAPLETWQRRRSAANPLSLAWRTLFPSRQHLDARAAARTAPAAGPCLGWITRAASLATRAARLSWHWLLHRRQSARQTALLRRRMQLRRWINDDSA